jgi:hypothetical protein
MIKSWVFRNFSGGFSAKNMVRIKTTREGNDWQYRSRTVGEISLNKLAFYSINLLYCATRVYLHS